MLQTRNQKYPIDTTKSLTKSTRVLTLHPKKKISEKAAHPLVPTCLYHLLSRGNGLPATRNLILVGLPWPTLRFAVGHPESKRGMELFKRYTVIMY